MQYKHQVKLRTITVIVISTALIISIAVYYSSQFTRLNRHIVQLNAQDLTLQSQLETAKQQLIQSMQEADNLKSQDQYIINQQLEEEIKNIHDTYQTAVAAYEELLDVKSLTKKTDKYDAAFANALALLSKRNYASASATISQLKKDLTAAKSTLVGIGANAPVVNTAPASGYKRQNVQTASGTFLVDIIAANLNSVRVIVDTASDGNCANDCPVLALADFAARSGAFAAINGPYFCPASYPSCSDKKNSFDTLLMNKNKVYFNSENNIYSTVPAVIFQGNTARFVRASQEWGRDTEVDAVIANQPLLVINGEVAFYGDSETKRSSRGGRSFIGATASTAYIGVVHSATVAEAAVVVKTMGIQNALNLDDGGSTALWSGKYIVGPGRNLPFGILLVRK